MATLFRQPASLCFSSDVDDIEFSTASVSGSLTLSLTYGGSRHVILEETMYASGGKVCVCDLSQLVEPYAREYLHLTLDCSFSDSSGSCSISPVTVIFSMADVGMTASAFTSGHFLTTLNGEKITAIGREERLYAYGAAKVFVTAVVRNSAGVFQTYGEMELTASVTREGVSQFNVSPDNISALGLPSNSVLQSYTVAAGGRTQSFRVVVDPVPPAPSLVFVNSFGCQEFIHCVGTHKKDSKYERKQTRIMGRLRNYRIIEDRQFTANTGWLNEAMADWADELFRSSEVNLWVNGEKGREVVLSDSKSEVTNEDSHMPAFEFTYTYAQRIHNVMQPNHAGRIFDNTFDHTFN